MPDRSGDGTAALTPLVLPDAVYDRLRTAILEQREPPGSTLTESAVSQRFGVARPTAKIAIERLVAEGLLRRVAYRTARVAELSREDIRDIYDSRAAVEAAALSALAVSGVVPRAALTAHRDLLAGAEVDAPFAPFDIEFHRGLVAGAPSPRLTRMHALLMGEIELGIAQGQAHRLFTAREIATQHQGILDAVTRRDIALTERLIREHIAGARDRLLAHFDASHAAAVREETSDGSD